jgi:hypothetical protein
LVPSRSFNHELSKNDGRRSIRYDKDLSKCINIIVNKSDMHELVRDLSSRFFPLKGDDKNQRPRGFKRASSKGQPRKEALQQRLEELVVLEIRREG